MQVQSRGSKKVLADLDVKGETSVQEFKKLYAKKCMFVFSFFPHTHSLVFIFLFTTTSILFSTNHLITTMHTYITNKHTSRFLLLYFLFTTHLWQHNLLAHFSVQNTAETYNNNCQCTSQILRHSFMDTFLSRFMKHYFYTSKNHIKANGKR